MNNRVIKILFLTFVLLSISCSNNKVGMTVTLEVMVVDVIKALSNYSKDEAFNTAIANSKQMQKNSQDDFVTLFAMEYEKLAPAPNAGLSAIFSTPDLRDKVQFSSTNKEVIEVLSIEVEDAIERSFNILRSRIDRFGFGWFKNTNISRTDISNRLVVELPQGLDSLVINRIRNMLQSTGQLGFWETYKYSELFQGLEQANSFLKETTVVAEEEETTNDEVEEVENIESAEVIEEDGEMNSLLAELTSPDTATSSLSFEEFASENPLYALLYPNVNQ